MPKEERPLDSEDGVVVEFARDLRLLRRKAGSPTYRALSARAHYSAAALSEAASGRKLPSLPVTVAYVVACGGDIAQWEIRWRTTAAELAAAKAVPSSGGDDDGVRAPYAGLAPFQQEDTDRFFGRDKLVTELMTRVQQRRFIGVFGASGCGKSSLLRAGLAARLSAERKQDNVPVMVFTPGRHPIEECAVHLARFLDEPPGSLRDEIWADPRNLHLRIRQAAADDATGSEVVLIVDQFEELFTLCGDEQERAAFIDALVAAVTDPASRTRVVLGVRADFLGHCGRYPGLVDALRDGQVLVGAMSTDELRAAITRPAEQAGYRVETALVARLAAEAAREPGMLPLVSHALLQTWRRRQGAVMTVFGYDATGGIEHALARTADEVYQSLDTGQQDIAQQIFLRLTALGEGTEDTKRRIARNELDHDNPNTALVLDTLTQARLLTVGYDSVEIAHEALIRHWPRLRDWLADDREGHRVHRQLTEAAAEWERHQQDDGLLYRGARLAAWQDRPLDRLNDTECTFLTTSRRAAEREHRMRRRRVRLTVSGFGTATAIVTVLAVIALTMATRADNQRVLAESRGLVTAARAQLHIDPELGLLLAREAYAAAQNDETEATLRQAILDSHIRFTVPKSEGPVRDVAFSADGKHLVTVGKDSAIRIWGWDAERRTWIVLRRLNEAGSRGKATESNKDSMGALVFSRDKSRIVIIDPAGAVSVWDWADRDEPVTFKFPETGRDWEGSVIALSPDNQRLAVASVAPSAGDSAAIEIWNIDGTGQPELLPGHFPFVTDVTFSPDGQRLASSGPEGTARIWNLVEGGNPIVLRGHQGQVNDVTFSPDGRHVTTTGDDTTVRVWDAPVVLGSHDEDGAAVTYSKDGRLIASTSFDGTVRIWNVDHRAPSTVLRGHHGLVHNAAFSPDGRSVASVSLDGAAKIWDVDAVENVSTLHGQEGPVQAVASSPDGRQVAAVSRLPGTVRIWDTVSKRTPIVLPEKHYSTTPITFSSDGRHLATVASDGNVLVWNTHDYTKPVHARAGPSMDVAFSPDGKRLAIVTARSLSIWDAAGRKELQRLPGFPEQGVELGDVNWSPNGHHIAVSIKEDVILLWDLRTGADPFVLPGHPGVILALAFSPDGTRLVSGGTDGTINLWNITTNPTQPTVLHGHQDSVVAAAFSPEGQYLITNSLDNTMRIWKTNGTSDPLVVDDFRASVSAVVPMTNGQYLTAHDDGTIQIWRCPACAPITEVLATADRHTTRSLTAEERRTYRPTNS